MSVVSPSRVASQDASAWNTADLGEQTDDTTILTDGDKVIASAVKWGKSPDDVCRIEFTQDKADLADGDTITIYGVANIHNVATVALLAYSGSASAVTETDKITLSLSAGDNTFTLTTAFIGQLFDQGSGAWAVRCTEDGGISGDYKMAEVDADITISGAVVPGDEGAYMPPQPEPGEEIVTVW